MHSQMTRVLKITKVITDATLRALFDSEVTPRFEKLIFSVSSVHALATLTPLRRPDTGISLPLIPNISTLREVLACKVGWEEISRVDEYDDRWSHSIRVRSEVCIDPVDPLQRGRSAQIRLLFFVVKDMPQLQSCLVSYEEISGSSSPMSLICAKSP
jgi:hypothetical protein